MIRLRAILAVTAALVAAPAFGVSPDPKDLAVPPQELSRARELVRRLGSDVYREREDAQAELLKMGRLARGPIAEAAAGDADPEVRQRAAKLLPKASSDDLKARIDTFLADAEGKYEHDLPGLKAFREHVGTADKARALYVDILKSPHNMEMLAAVDRGPAEGGRAIADRRGAMWSELQNPNRFGGINAGNGKPFVPRQPTLPELAALLFAETMVPSENIPRTTMWVWVNGAQFVQQNASIQALNGSAAHAEAYKGIVSKWLLSRTDPIELANLSHPLGNGVLRPLKDSQLVLRRILLTDGVQGYARGQALNGLLANNRAKDELPLLRAILKNQVRVGDYPGVLPNKKDPDEVISVGNDQMATQVWFNKPNGLNEMHSCLLKDVALAHLINLSGGNLKDYGFESPQGASFNPGNLNYGGYAFTSDVARNTGFMKYAWKQFKDGLDPKPAPNDSPTPKK
jgi:hypothetical protein